MKPRTDVNEQERIITFTFNIPVTDKPIDIKKNSTKKRLQRQLEESTFRGEELIYKLLGIAGVYKITISGYEIEVIYKEHYNSTGRRESIAAIMKAEARTLGVPEECVIVTTDASRGDDILPEVDPQLHDH